MENKKAFIEADEEITVIKLNQCNANNKDIITYYLSLLSANNKVTLPYLKEFNDSRKGAGAYEVYHSLTNKITSTKTLYVKTEYYKNMMFYVIANDVNFEEIIAAKYVEDCIKDSTFNITISTYLMDGYDIKRVLFKFLNDNDAIKTYGLYNCHFHINLNKYNDKRDIDGFYYYKPTNKTIETSHPDLIYYVKTKELFSGYWQELGGVEGELIQYSKRKTHKTINGSGFNISRDRYETITKNEYENFRNGK